MIKSIEKFGTYLRSVPTRTFSSESQTLKLLNQQPTKKKNLKLKFYTVENATNYSCFFKKLTSGCGPNMKKKN